MGISHISQHNGNGNGYQTITTKTITTTAKQPPVIRSQQIEYQYKPVSDFF